MDMPYQLALPTLPHRRAIIRKSRPATRISKAFLAEVKKFAITDYAAALAAGRYAKAWPSAMPMAEEAAWLYRPAG